MMSREEVSIRQHRSRLLQLAESPTHKATPKRRSYTSAPRSNGANKNILTQEPSYTPNIEHLVFPERRNSNPASKSPLQSPMSGFLPNGGKNNNKSRSRLAEVFALSRHQQKIGSTSVDSGLKLNTPPSRKSSGNGSSHTSGGGDPVGGGQQHCGVGPQWASASSAAAEEPVLHHDGNGGRLQPPQQTQQTQQRASPSPESNKCWSAASQHGNRVDGADTMATTRGSNISILHLRSTSEPWESLTTSSYGVSKNGRSTTSSRNGGVSSIPSLQVKYSGGNSHYSTGNYGNNSGGGNYGNGSDYGSNGVAYGNGGPRNIMSGYASLPYGRRRDPAGPAALFLAESNGQNSSGNGGSCQRELSPVRWCDREVDGVYLGRSGWVQVQQRSLDENRRGIYQVPVTSTPTEAPTMTVKSGTLPSRRPGMKMADYHCISEPGNFPEAIKVEDQQRPAYLPLPLPFGREYEHRVSSRSSSPSPLDNGPISPPSITPIISPPPAFQDSTRRYGTAPRSRGNLGKPPFLPRSNAVDTDILSPPESPPPINWSTLPTSRLRRLTPSPVATPSLRLPQTKSLEDTSARRTQFQKYDSSSSSSSSFGFRSLDSSLSVRAGAAMPRLSETDSSVGGYEDGDEDDRDSSLNLSGFSSLTVVNSSPELPSNLQPRERVVNGDKVSPSSLRHARTSRSSHQARRSPGSDSSHKKLNDSSSSSSSSSSSCGRTPSRRASNHSASKLRPEAHAYHTWDGRHRVRRSRSLQLPEPGKSPSPGSREPMEYQNNYQYYNQQPTEQHRVVVKIGQEQSVRRPYMTHRKTHSEDGIRKEGLRWEAHEEVRAVTEYLYGTRSRAAARALLMHRYHDRPELPAPPATSDDPRTMPDSGFNVFFVPRNNKPKQQQHVLQRGNTTPTSSGHVFSQSPDSHACSPNSCDYWPHCAHRERPNQYSPQNPTKSPSPPNNMRQSQSYPSTQNRVNGARVYPPEKRAEPPRRASPASLDRVDEYGFPLERNGAYTTDMPRRFDRLKIGLDTSSSASSSMDQEPKTYKAAQRQNSPGLPKSVEDEFERPSSVAKERRASPSAASVNFQPSGTSSSSSSSSDVWVTTSDRTLTKSLRTLKSSGTSTPLDDASVFKSPVSRVFCDVQRPGSAPAEVDDDGDKVLLDAQQRSLSLPKSFLSQQRTLLANSRQSGAFPWRRQASGPCATAPGSPLPDIRVASPSLASSHTAPATPVKEQHGSDSQYRRSPGISKSVRRGKVASPLDETATSRSDWDIRRCQWVENCPDAPTATGSSSYLASTPTPAASLLLHPRLVNSDKEFSQSQRNISGNISSSESVLQKFRKTFALKFHKKSGSREEEGGMDDVLCHDDDPHPHHHPHQHPDPLPLLKDDTASDPRFKFGPLVWRSSKERKKTKKAARNAKCNSGDSGIQIEMIPGSLHIGGGDSSESHDTDHPMDDEMDSPPLVRRRTTTDKTMRPQSELINQILIDKFKADLQTRSQHRSHHVRRTHSDLGGQRLFNWDVRNSYRRMFSTPSPIKMRPPRISPPPRPADTGLLRSSRSRSGRAHLRRSMSQPLGINELSPLMRRKPRALVASDDDRGGTSDDEVMSDSESSVVSTNERKKSFDDELVILAEAVWDHVAMETEELAFRAGDVVEVLDTVDRDWWWGTRGENSGWFPAAFVRLRVSQEDTVEDCLAAMASGSTSTSQLRRRTSISLLSNDQVRSSVVRELVNTERDFVKILRDVSEGYLAECLRRADMFSADQIRTIFGNVEELLSFQAAFLEDLERRVDWEAPHRSCVGQCFLVHRAGFRIYSEYCNSHPLATATLQELYQHSSYSQFFEACRLMRGLMEIPLDGYLLTPVQRICKYPLQLAELLKYTKSDHPDYAKIGEALEAMRGVAVLVNERKRRMESLEKIVGWQMRVEGWEDEDLIEASSQLIHQGEVVRVTTGMWTTNIILFLFDHQLVYCKKDILKRNTHVYKGRIQLDTSEIINVPDGKDPQLGASVRHGLKVYSCVRDKWLLFCCRSVEDKLRWLEAFAEERRLVAQDRHDGLYFPPAARQLAQTAARCQRRPPSKPRNKTYKRDSGYSSIPSTEVNSHGHMGGGGSTNSLGRKVGTWFTFGSNKKGRAGPHHHP